ncbi:MAG: hypothetical protein CBB97_07250 [Candidatus Endolissoclinum sp. TMED37]|nr:MAG: hypothetical protein CBB97_07250 [Candidatus Endolissoclinum sp. TMED37]
MQYFKKFWEWITRHAIVIVVAILVLVYAYANLLSIRYEREKSEDDFRCQTLCFPQQYEYLYAGEVAACWCYENTNTLKKLEK